MLFVFSLMMVILCGLVCMAVALVGMGACFARADKPAWAVIVPVYNLMVLSEVGGKPAWWGLLFLIPLAGLVFAAIVTINVATDFGRSIGFGVGLLLSPFVFYPLLGFGDAEYEAY